MQKVIKKMRFSDREWSECMGGNARGARIGDGLLKRMISEDGTELAS